MKLRIEAASSCGPVRAVNQDVAVVGMRLVRDDALSFDVRVEAGTPPFVCAVADGMGGHNAGELASRIVSETLTERVQRLSGTEAFRVAGAFLQRCVAEAHAVLMSAGAADPRLAGMGTTLTGLLLGPQMAVVFHVGDSRLYRLRDGMLTQLTRDHTMRALTADVSMPPNLIANAVGGGGDVFVELQDLHTRIHKGDVYLLCSDGVPAHLSTDAIEQALCAGADASALCRTAIGAGGTDNTTAIRIDVLLT